MQRLKTILEDSKLNERKMGEGREPGATARPG